MPLLRHLLLLLAFSAPTASSITAAVTPPSGTYSLAAFGAKLDGVSNDRAALQAAIDAAAAAGGGRVVIPAGRTVLTGSFALKSRVELHLEPGSLILGSIEQADYRGRTLIEAFNAEDIAITGTGHVDARGIAFMAVDRGHIFTPAAWRPGLMLLEACRRVRIRDVTFRDSPSWGIHLAGCDDVVIDGVTILNNLKIPNCDGIDPDNSRNVRITNCHIEAGDDAIVIKASRQYAHFGGSENIIVSHCTLRSTSAALKIGTETVAPIRNVIFTDCVISRSHRGVAFMLRDEGSIENVLVQNLVIETALHHPDWWGAAEPLYISAHPRTPETKIGRIRGIRVHNIMARSEGGVVLMGSPASPLEQIELRDFTLDLLGSAEFAPGRLDLRPPDARGVEDGPLIGLRVQHAKDVALRDGTVYWRMTPPAGAVAWQIDDATAEVRMDNVRERR